MHEFLSLCAPFSNALPRKPFKRPPYKGEPDPYWIGRASVDLWRKGWTLQEATSWIVASFPDLPEPTWVDVRRAMVFPDYDPRLLAAIAALPKRDRAGKEAA